MPLELTALISWIIVTIVFIVIVGVLYRKVTKTKKQEPDERKDETPPY